MYTIKKNAISLVRGDTLVADLNIDNYIPQEGDSFRFAMKRTYNDLEPELIIDIPADTLVLRIESEDTKPLQFGQHVYDIQLTRMDGTVDTFIKGTIKLLEEVD